MKTEDWISVKELKPRHHVVVLVTNASDKWINCGLWDGREWYNQYDEQGAPIIPTHWMPLPEPPKP